MKKPEFMTIDIDPLEIMLTKWCVDCYPEKARAHYTYQGDSICQQCFKKRKERESKSTPVKKARI